MLTVLGLLFLVPCALAQNVIEDNGVGMSMQELEQLVKYWTPDMQKAAAMDVGDRFELLNMALASKKIALEAVKVTPESDPDRYWKNQFVLRNSQRDFVVKTYMADLEIPDMSALAEEMYLTSKDKYASIPEARMTSHILIRCTPPECDQDEKRAEAEAVLAELESGASFESLVKQYSEDPGSKDKGGVFDRWLEQGMPRVERHYLIAAFEIEGAGNHSGIVHSQFGFHIIRLDEIREKSYKPYDEVRDEIISSLVTDYKRASAKEFDAQFRLSDKAFIDPAAMDKIFGPYKEPEAAGQ
jgi:parvulin-like peptidyl-prolyl isomerase